jgi:hypothetical protein
MRDKKAGRKPLHPPSKKGVELRGKKEQHV